MRPNATNGGARWGSNRNRAFTLVEILVVIAIVAALAALLLPAFDRARAGGRRATCASNLKQLALAFNLYAQDYRAYPTVDSGGHECLDWPYKIYSYVKSEAVFECPSFPRGQFVRSDGSCTNADNTDPAKPRLFLGSYDVNLPNAKFYWDPVTHQRTMSTPVRSQVVTFNPKHYTRPSTTILLLDGDGQMVSPGYEDEFPATAREMHIHGVDFHHEGGSNVAFADGHVKWLSMGAMFKRSLWRVNGPE